MKNAVVELNGKQYDARTGKILSNSTPKEVTHKSSVIHNVDGVQKVHSKKSPSPSRATRTTYSPKHTPQRATTLNRFIVKKPVTRGTKSRLEDKNTSHDRQSATTLGDHSSSRLERALNVKPSSFIQKFNYKNQELQTKLEKLDVVPIPRVVEAQAQVNKHAVGSSAIENFVQHQISTARSHEQTFEVKGRGVHHRISRSLGVSKRTAGMLTTGFALLVLGGFFAYQNVPNFAVRVASKRAGFVATLPGYKPSGFAMDGPMKYSPGKLTLSFASNADKNRSFNITQTRSAWDSETLLNNVIASANKPYQTYNQNGLTIYLYDDNSATWVDKGVWYTIDGKADLSTDQLVKLASSM